MNVLSAMAGICDGEFCMKFTKENIDIITLGGYNSDLETDTAGIENTKNNRQEFIIKPTELSSHISKQVEIIRNYNPSWQGLISVNLRGIKPESFRVVKNNKNIDILEINAHCRQEAVVKAGAGEGLLKDKKRLSQVLDEVSSYDMDVSVKIRANVCGVDTLEITKLIESYNIDYIHLDATNPGIMEADYEIIEEVSNNTEIHLIGNNSVTTHDDYMKMINSGADSVSVARAALNGNIQDIFY